MPWTCPCCTGAGEAIRPTRRGLLGGTLACVAAGLTAPALAQSVAGGGPRVLAIQRVQTGDRFNGVYWRDGRYDRDALHQLNRVFRDPSLDEETPMDPRLLDVLSTVSRLMGASEAFQVISGYRAPETNASRARQSRRVSTVSLHMSGMAADVRLPGYDSLGMARLAAEMQVGGVGLYRRDGFVHLDCGPARRW